MTYRINEMTEVTHEELKEFLRTYPRPLSYNVVTICEPPFKQWHDWSLTSGRYILGTFEYADECMVACYTSEYDKDYPAHGFRIWQPKEKSP